MPDIKNAQDYAEYEEHVAAFIERQTANPKRGRSLR